MKSLHHLDEHTVIDAGHQLGRPGGHAGRIAFLRPHHDLGLRRIGELMPHDRPSLARRFPPALLARLDEAGGLFISVLRDPTTGGVTASFAMLGDLILAEPKALIGFAGPRVIESTVRVTLPEGFQRAEFLMQKGAVDLICDRRELRKTLAQSLAMLQRLPADAVV